MAGNGRLPLSVLASIAGPTPGTRCYLRRDAAAAWNAMAAEAQRRYGVTLRPLGMMSAYRTYAQQVFLWNGGGGTVAHPRNPNWVARPGTSNHGWGLAVDLQTRQMRRIVDEIGAAYGWAKKWSDAPVEWWHIRWRPGVWKPHQATVKPLRFGSRGPRVKALQRRLRALGFHSVRVTGFYGLATRSAVRRFQNKHGLHVDGVVGPGTADRLRRATR